jgi:hypothetical protein
MRARVDLPNGFDAGKQGADELPPDFGPAPCCEGREPCRLSGHAGEE